MKVVGSHPTYEEAEQYQISLIAEGIDSELVTPSRDLGAVAYGIPPEYRILVDERDLDAAAKLVEKPQVDDYVPLVRCPRCGSGEKKEYEGNVFLAMIGFILIIPIFVAFVCQRVWGRKYVCLSCSKTYRYNFRRPEPNKALQTTSVPAPKKA